MFWHQTNVELFLILLIWGWRKVCNLTKQELCLREPKLYAIDHSNPMSIIRCEWEVEIITKFINLLKSLKTQSRT